jgi:hypothetical protein
LALLLQAQEAGIFKLAKGTKAKGQTKAWKDFTDQCFLGRLNSDNTRDGNGIFRGWDRWDSTDPHNSKMKPLVKGIVEHFSAEYEKRVNKDDATTLEDVAWQLMAELKSLEVDKTIRADEVFAQRLQNEGAETELGMRPTSYGVSAPSGVNLDDNQVAVLEQLPRATASVLQTSRKLLLILYLINPALLITHNI